MVEPIKYYNKDGSISRRALELGYVQANDYCTLSMIHGFYRVTRHPSHPEGWDMTVRKNLTDARKVFKEWGKKQ